MADTNQPLGHADDADGIEEYDNPLPDWWVGLFLICILFAGVYPIWFHGMGNTQTEAYDREMAAAEIRWPKSDQSGPLPTDAATLALGEEVFGQTCASCHNADMSGGIGPNLLDDTWIHGSSGAEIVATITNGVKEKGMPAWGAILGPKKTTAAAAYVLSKQGSAPTPPTQPPPAKDVVADAPVDARALFGEKCAVCHKADMTGQIGPNLIDAEWIHGGELEQITATITNGVPDKGMVAWGPLLTSEQISALAQFVHTKGTASTDAP